MRDRLAAPALRALTSPYPQTIPNPIFARRAAHATGVAARHILIRSDHEIRRWPARSAFRRPDPDHRQGPLYRRHHACPTWRRPTCCARRSRTPTSASIDATAARRHARRAAGADRRRREGRRARRRALPCAAQQPGRLAAPRYAAPGARDRQGAPCRPAGRARRRRDTAAGAGRRRGDRDRLRDAARRHRRARRAGEGRAAAVRRHSRQSGVRLGQRHLGLRRDRCGLRQGRARHHARDRQQPRGGELDGAAQRDRRLGRGGRPAGALHRHAGLALRARSARRGGAESAEGEAARRDAAECRRRLRHEGVRLSRAGAGGVGGRASSSGRCAGSRTARKASSPTIRAAITSPAPSLRWTRRASSSACACRSSPISARISRRWARSFRRARPI